MDSIKNCTFLSHLRNSEHFDFHRGVSEYVSPVINDLPEVQPMWGVLYNLFVKEDDIFKHSAKAIETKYITDIADRRHSEYMMVRRTIEAAAYSLDPQEKDAAEKLTEVMDNYKAIVKSNYVASTSLIYNMIQDLRLPRYSCALGKLGLTAAVNTLEDVNIEFSSIYDERSLNNELISKQGTMRKIRVDVDKAFKIFTNGVDAMYVSNKLSGKNNAAALYLQIIDFINARINQFELILAHRGYSTGGKKGDDGDEPETPAGIPELAVSRQEVQSADWMLLVMENQPVFADALYPMALDGILRLSADDYNDYPDFPIAEFEMDGDKPVGFSVHPPQDGLVFKWPMNAITQARAEVLKDDVVLATLTGVVWPEAYWE